MKMIRSGIGVAAIGALMILPVSFASAAATTVVVTPDDMQGWRVDTGANSTTSAFVAGPRTIGTGSVRFGPIAAEPRESKFIIGRAGTIGLDSLDSISFDHYIDPAAVNKAPEQYYMNVYVDSFHDCRYDFVASTGGDGWHTVSITPSTPAVVASRVGPCGDSLDDVADGSSIFLFSLDGGDTSIGDAGIKGGFDNVRVTSAASTTTYDFEPAEVTACDAVPAPGRVGTPGPDVVRGAAAAERFDLLGGNDVLDALAGDDCVLGGAGADRLRTGDGADETFGGTGSDVIDSGAGADIVDPGAGSDTVTAGAGDDRVFARDGRTDTVDRGPGTDTVVADPTDALRNCELVTRPV